MKILSAIGLLAVFTAARLQDIPDLPGLAVAIIEAVKRDAGIGPDATHPPLAWGPIVVDEETFTGIFNMLDDGAGVEVRDTLLARGYVMGSLDSLLRSEVDSLGVTNYWLANEAILIRVLGVDSSEMGISVVVMYRYTYDTRPIMHRSVACHRMLRIDFDYIDSQWQEVRSRVIGEC